MQGRAIPRHMIIHLTHITSYLNSTIIFFKYYFMPNQKISLNVIGRCSSQFDKFIRINYKDVGKINTFCTSCSSLMWVEANFSKKFIFLFLINSDLSFLKINFYFSRWDHVYIIWFLFWFIENNFLWTESKFFHNWHNLLNQKVISMMCPKYIYISKKFSIDLFL